MSLAQIISCAITMRKSVHDLSGAPAGAKLKQKKALVVPAVAALEVLEDEELAKTDTQARAVAAPQGTLRRRLDAEGLQEHLQQDPLRLHKVCCNAACADASGAHCLSHARMISDMQLCCGAACLGYLRLACTLSTIDLPKAVL